MQRTGTELDGYWPNAIVEKYRLYLVSLGASILFHCQHAAHYIRKALPVRGVFAQLPLPCSRDRIEFRLAIVIRDAPLGRNPAFLLQTYKRGIDRSLVEQHAILAHLLNPARNSVSMLRTHHGERLQYHQVQRTLHQVQL